MANIKVSDYDRSNISGHKLAELGRHVLAGKKFLDEQYYVEKQQDIKEGDYTHIGWLDMRVNQICERGRL